MHKEIKDYINASKILLLTLCIFYFIFIVRWNGKLTRNRSTNFKMFETLRIDKACTFHSQLFKSCSFCYLMILVLTLSVYICYGFLILDGVLCESFASSSYKYCVCIYICIIMWTISETFTQYINQKRKTKTDELSYIQNKNQKITKWAKLN